MGLGTGEEGEGVQSGLACLSTLVAAANALKHPSQVSPRVYKGIPDRWRASAWETLADSFAAADCSRKGKQRASSADELLAEYSERIDRPSSFDVQIDLDVPRTVSGHVLFHTRYGLGCVGPRALVG